MLKFGWSPLILWFPSSSVLVRILWWFTKRTNNNWYHCHFHVPKFFQFSCKIHEFTSRFAFFQFYTVITRNIYVYIVHFYGQSQGLVVWPYCCYYYIIRKFFFISVSWWTFSGVCIAAIFIRSLWVLVAFLPILTMLWSRFFFDF